MNNSLHHLCRDHFIDSIFPLFLNVIISMCLYQIKNGVTNPPVTTTVWLTELTFSGLNGFNGLSKINKEWGHIFLHTTYIRYSTRDKLFYTNGKRAKIIFWQKLLLKLHLFVHIREKRVRVVSILLSCSSLPLYKIFFSYRQVLCLVSYCLGSLAFRWPNTAVLKKGIEAIYPLEYHF